MRSSVLVVLTMVVLIMPAAYGAVDNETIPADTYHSEELELGDRVEFWYNVTVTEGPSIDVFLMDPVNFERYEAGENFTYVEDMSVLGTRSTERSMTVPEHRTYYLVIDNTDVGTAAEGAVWVTWEVGSDPERVDEGLRDLPLVGFIISVLALVGMALAVVLYLPWRRFRGDVPPPPEEMPPSHR